ncbi:MAG: hypothetical protein HC908_11735 [Calothrix sp. SM1_7_51]|nr:hypothetical protein [Calothrix sp. SM1_7_51]
MENNQELSSGDIYYTPTNESLLEYQVCELSNSVTPVLTQARLHNNSLTKLQQAELIIGQAQSLAQEWQDNFQAHLRFGCIATELSKVVESEAADILF